MTRYYQKEDQRLIYIEQRATADYWEQHWDALAKSFVQIRQTRKSLVTDVTKRYLNPSDGPILEGGCGNGQQVAALVNHGYECVGVDYAEQTVAKINQHMPDLDIRAGDVRQLDFPNASFRGYWSLGVIEHFWDGFESIAAEMARVIVPGGYLFVTFPYLSPLRKVKSKLNQYPEWQSDLDEPESFYQFALNEQYVINTLLPFGFKLAQKKPAAGLKGLKDELPRPLRSQVQKFYDYKGKQLIIRGIRYGLDRFFSLFCGHVMLLVFERVQNEN